MVVTDILGDGPPIPANFIRLAQPWRTHALPVQALKDCKQKPKHAEADDSPD
jgi:hypothetical protein